MVIRADGNGTYRNTRSTKQMYVIKDGKTHTNLGGRREIIISIKKLPYNSFSKVFVDISEVIQLHHSYGKAKKLSFDIRIIVTMTRPINSPSCPHVGVFLQCI